MISRKVVAVMAIAASIGLRPAVALEAKPMVQSAASDDAALADRLMAAVRPVRAGNIMLWTAPEALTPDETRAFAVELNTALAAIEEMVGEPVDAAHFGDATVHVFVSPDVRVSHVYGGYAHPRYNRPYLYLNPQRVRNRAAPYLHELTHIVLWQFGSHSLREGFASYVEGRLAEEGIGYNSGVFGPGSREEVDQAAATVLSGDLKSRILPWIGRSGGTDRSITSTEEPETRAAFYVLTRSFVHHLLDGMDVPTFIRLYRAEDTELAYREITGRSLEQWRDSWMASLKV